MTEHHSPSSPTDPEDGRVEHQPVDGTESADAGEGSRSSRKATWVAMAAVALALGLIWVAPGIAPHEDPPPSGGDGASAAASGETAEKDIVGKEAPLDYALKDMNGADVTLASYKGKIVLLNFWATWCGPCKAEIPSLVMLQEQYRNDLVVLGLSVDDPVEKLKPYADEYQMNYPVLIGKGHEKFQDAFGPMWGIPVSVIIGRDGRIAKKHSGIATKEQFEREIKALL